ncbi:nucleoside 2-deoxyribosyltransferase [Lampropedia puyangensis]|uniref:Nucleoside 2-deoxyribosyltransferase n=1 Tax=Lampropedia puyangensis TaxID=1330072 RepID=A0A4S8FEV3_9BURK|nr:nucleoside 2-deoxyribosyltransferase [Lampropedia puyangensis]THU05174.1 nucleoside 2-deoxyribosyltransferase [Lampropedia puyangensis]
MPASNTTPRPRLYLAGPDVFYQDHARRYSQYKATCLQYGMQGLSPLDNTLPLTANLAAKAQTIYQANIALIAACDGVMAHLSDFRGCEPDSGTVFEMGYAIALGKPVVVWGRGLTQAYKQRVLERLELPPHAHHDASEAEIEDFGLPLNLMLACSCISIEETFAVAAQAMATHLLE